MFGFNAIITERSNDLELERPTLGNKHVRNSASLYPWISICVLLRQMLCNQLCELGLAIGPYPALKLFEWHAGAVDRSYGARNVVDELLQIGSALWNRSAAGDRAPQQLGLHGYNSNPVASRLSGQSEQLKNRGDKI